MDIEPFAGSRPKIRDRKDWFEAVTVYVTPDGFPVSDHLLSPRRKERVLVVGAMFLEPSDGALVRLEGRLAKSPSLWVKHVDVVRTYKRIEGTVVPVALETKADVRFVGEATLRMTYSYSEIDGRSLSFTAR